MNHQNSTHSICSQAAWPGHTLDLLRLLANLSGLLHDIGKSSQETQSRMKKVKKEVSLVRHEWISLRLWEAFVGDDADEIWLKRLASPSREDDQRWTGQLKRDGIDGCVPSPFKTLKNAPLAQAIGWLIVTHHRLPEIPKGSVFQISSLPGILDQLQPSWIEGAFLNASPKALQDYWSFPKGLPMTTEAWKLKAQSAAKGLLDLYGRERHADPSESGAFSNIMKDPFVMHLSRLCLMLGDHYYSSLEGPHEDRAKVKAVTPLIANTKQGSKPGSRKANQTLEEHLIGVGLQGQQSADMLPAIKSKLRGLKNHVLLEERAHLGSFQWQDKASDLAKTLQSSSEAQGAFIVNMASTGTGKTKCNANIMYALSDPQKGMRCSFAMGLRNLTLKSGRAFEEKLGFKKEDLAIKVGGSESEALFEYHREKAAESGSESSVALLAEEDYIEAAPAAAEDSAFRRMFVDEKLRSLIAPPVLVCTIDHLTPSTESQRGGRQIAPMLRLLSGDLVLDEPDDFSLEDQPALLRLVNWAGMLGSRVLLSSATLSPAFVAGLFEAYRRGRECFNASMTASKQAGNGLPVKCLWVDEFDQVTLDCNDKSAFALHHQKFTQKRALHLTKMAELPRRRGEVLALDGVARHRKSETFKKSAGILKSPGATERQSAPASIQDISSGVAKKMLETTLLAHQTNHSIDPISAKKVSFGVIRMANIEPLIEVAMAFFKESVPDGVRLHICVYHSRHALIVRSAMEARLSSALNREDSNAVFATPEIRSAIDSSREKEHIFLVIASPVIEVGQNFDFDWAIAEPSSMKSLGQLVGRVRRHRTGTVETSNVFVLSENLKNLLEPDLAVFCFPGFEGNGEFRLKSHDVREIVGRTELSTPDSRPMILCAERVNLKPKDKLVDLEHARIFDQMALSSEREAPIHDVKPSKYIVRSAPTSKAHILNASTWIEDSSRDAMLTHILQQQQPFRAQQRQKDVVAAMLPVDDEEAFEFHKIVGGGKLSAYAKSDRDLKIIHNSEVRNDRISAWATPSYEVEIEALSKELGMEKRDCAEKFGSVSLPRSERGWRYHPILGFSKRRD